jgi:hypothetical protein
MNYNRIDGCQITGLDELSSRVLVAGNIETIQVGNQSLPVHWREDNVAFIYLDRHQCDFPIMLSCTDPAALQHMGHELIRLAGLLAAANVKEDGG